MARKYLAFDIETAKEVPGTDFDWRSHRPLGIACAAVLPCDAPQPFLWHGRNADGTPAPQMSRHEARCLVEQLSGMVSDGYTLLTWNGLQFDLDVLAEEADTFPACRSLARAHVDMMFHVFCDRGFPVALEKAAEALKIPGKLGGMSGMLAPQWWAQGRYQEVLDYVTQDVRMTLEIAQRCEKLRSFAWVTRKGTTNSMPLRQGWLTVEQALRLPEPDTSWMSHPLSRQQFVAWLREGTEGRAV